MRIPAFPSRALSVIPSLFRVTRRLSAPARFRVNRARSKWKSDETAAISSGDPWYDGDFPMRRGSAVSALIDGEMYFGELLTSLRAAQRRVTICGWCLTPLMSLSGKLGDEDAILARVLDEVSQRADVYVLLWAGAPLLFEPTTRLQESIRKALLQAAPRVQCLLDRTAHFSHDHHQKAVTVDGRVAYVGGMDLTTYAGERWDRQGHPLRHGPSWHDVQVRIEGVAAYDVERNFCQRWSGAGGEPLAPLTPPEPLRDGPELQVVRTVAPRTYDFAPDGITGIRHAIISAIGRARRFIYIENQYLWAPDVVDALADALQRNDSTRFRIVAVLPADAEEGKYDNDQHVDMLNAADDGRGAFAAYSLYTAGPSAGPTGYDYVPIYVHAKVMIVDDEWFTVGSANLNLRGLTSDSEMNVQVRDPAVARDLRVRLWAEHLAMPVEQVDAADPVDLIDGEWKRTAENMLRCRHAAGVPPRGQIHPYLPGKGPTDRLLDAIQSWTLEY